MTLVQPPFYSLEATHAPQWTTSQEKSIALDYPFDLQHESPQQFVTRSYLQFLWLPQSIMPLQLLIPSLRRVLSSLSSSQAPSDSRHLLLDPLLQTTRSISAKYHVELVQILMDGGGAGELEETMMWYALHHEKANDRRRSEPTGPESPELWMDEKWRKSWLERLERREVQIQILLYLTKLTLPDPSPAPPPKKKKRSRKSHDLPTPTLEEHLESFMDKLSMFQLSGHLEMNGPRLNHNERDWAQIFCENVVEPIFKDQLPELCLLLRSKVFPNSPFSDTEAMTASRSPSPELAEPQTDSRELPPAFSNSLVLPGSRPHTLTRVRSRSLSVSLAQEKEERERSVGVGPGKKRPLNREVSMSRVFRPKPKTSTKPPEHIIEHQANANGKEKIKQDEVVLVEDTPQKPRISIKKPSQSQFDSVMSSNNLFGVRQVSQNLFNRDDETDDDDAWMLDSSPDVLLLHPGRKLGSGDEYEVVTLQTPSKRPGQRGR